MATNMQLSTAARNAACNALVDLLDAGAAGGTIKIYTTPQPANANTSATGSGQTLLVTITCDATAAFGSAATGVATLDATPVLSGTAVATGTAVWFRAADSDGNTVFDGTVDTASADMILNTTSIVSGNTVEITAGTVTMPAA